MCELYRTKVEAFKKTHPDWDRVVNQRLPVHAQVQAVIIAMDNAPAIIYFLGLNPEYTKSLARMQLCFAFVEIGKLAAKLEE